MGAKYVIGRRLKRGAGALLSTAVLVAASAAGYSAAFSKERVQAAHPGTNGKIVYVESSSGRGNEIWVTNEDGTDQQQLTFAEIHTGGDDGGTYPNFSPDGSKIVFGRQQTVATPENPFDYNIDVFTMNADGTNQQRITTNPDSEDYANFSPDGTKIVFTRWEKSYGGGNDYDIYIMNADGTNEQQLTATPDHDEKPVFSPDGTRIAYITYSSVPPNHETWQYTITTMNVDGSDKQQIVDLEVSGNFYGFQIPDYSPDGSKIVFSTGSTDLGTEDHIIYMVDADGNNLQPIGDPNMGANPQWSPDGTKILYWVSGPAPDYAYYHMRTMNPDGTGITTIPAVNAYAFFPDWGPAQTVTPRTCNGLQATIVGTSAAETINGTAGDDVIVGLGGADTINGLGGNDTICGGGEADWVYGNAGNDYISGGTGHDNQLDGGGGNDTINGNAGADSIYGGAGDDILSGAADNDHIEGNGGNDLIEGNLGEDDIHGNGDNDELRGGQGLDLITGGNGDDLLFGNRGDDQLYGDAGNDTNNGGAETDYCESGTAVRCEL